MVPHRAAGGRGRQGRVTLQIGTDELAKRLYEAWRQREDVIAPTIETYPKPRPKWRYLDSLQQDVWRAVAEEAGHALADVMEAQ